jgi:hypothetical protein
LTSRASGRRSADSILQQGSVCFASEPALCGFIVFVARSEQSEEPRIAKLEPERIDRLVEIEALTQPANGSSRCAKNPVAGSTIGSVI